MALMKEFSYHSIRIKLAAVFAVTMLFTAIIIISITYKATESLIERQSRELASLHLKQTADTFDSFTNEILKTTILIAYNEDIRKMISRFNVGTYEEIYYYFRATNMITTLSSTNKYIHTIHLYNLRTNKIVSSRGTRSEIDRNSPEYKKIISMFPKGISSTLTKPIWLESRKISLNDKDEQVFTFIMPFNSSGIVAIYFTEQQISQLYNAEYFSANDRIFLVNKQGTIMSASDKELIGSNLSDYLPEGGRESHIVTEKGQKHLITHTVTNDTKWEFISIIPLIDLKKNSLIVMKQIFVLLIIISLIITVMIIRIFNKFFYKPVQYLVDSINKQDAEDDFKEYLVTRRDEIGFVFNSFKKILLENNRLLKNNYEQQLHLKDAEIRLLQSQINPHFLYNSLDAIIWMQKYNKSDDIIRLVKAMIKFFRISIDKGNEVTTVRQIKEQLESYFVIQNIRFADRLKVEIDFDPAILDNKILKLLLQPVVENSIHYGIEKKIGEGIIKITGVSEDNELIFTVEDNGIGVSSDRLAELKNNINTEVQMSDSFSALQNINKRIKLYYGDNYGIQLESQNGMGMLTTIRVRPL